MRKKGWIGIGAALLALLLFVVFNMDPGGAPTVALFAGRFHPTVVHFPIGLLLVAAAIELLAPRWDRAERARAAVPFILGLGALSALVAVLLGQLLSLGGGYETGLLDLHFWLGLSVLVVSAMLAAYAGWVPERGAVYRGMLGVLAVLVVFAGHFGGSLARGSGYLTYYLPSPIKSAFGMSGGAPEGLIADVDSAYVFADLVQPIFERRCVECHGASKSKGDLRLDSSEGIVEGGRDGPAFVAGNPSQSEIVRRITLPPYDEDAMPPDGEPPLDVGETELIRWWIAHGADFAMKVAQIDETPSAVSTYLARVSQPRVPRRSGIYQLEVAEADTSDLRELRASGMRITYLTPDAPFLQVGTAGIRDRFGDAQLGSLRAIAPQMAVLDAAHTSITDAGAAVLAAMPHLIHLHLEGTRVGDAALEHLADLEHLEYVNLYGTSVTDRGLQHLQSLPALRSVYLWQSQVTDEGAAALHVARPDVEVNIGSRFAALDDSTAAP